MKDTLPTSGEALKETLGGGRDGLGRKLSQQRKADLLSLHGLQTDLGYFRDPPPAYELDEPTRDRLLAHARQDAAQAVALATFLLQRQRRHSVLLWIVVLLLAFIAWRLA